MTAVSVTLQIVHPRKLAAVRREVAPGGVGAAWGPAVGKVSDFLRSQPSLNSISRMSIPRVAFFDQTLAGTGTTAAGDKTRLPPPFVKGHGLSPAHSRALDPTAPRARHAVIERQAPAAPS